MTSRDRNSSPSSLETYLSEVSRFPLLSADEEQRLARRFSREGDSRAGHALVTANLRFVVKVAYEYRAYGLSMGDLVQEGNIGLMRAVQKFDPEKGIRLISYAVWWIRAYIQNYVLRSWSLVKLGTTQAQRKLFFSLARTRRALAARAPAGETAEENAGRVARKLHVKPEEVEEMVHRLEARDLSLDAPVGDEGTASHVDFVTGKEPSQDETFCGAEERALLSSGVAAALARLDGRERFIIEHRVMSDRPMTLKDLGEHFGFSRERARQLEIRAKEKMRSELAALATALSGPAGGQPEQIDAAPRR